MEAATAVQSAQGFDAPSAGVNAHRSLFFTGISHRLVSQQSG
jgi:hypothetical protein